MVSRETTAVATYCLPGLNARAPSPARMNLQANGFIRPPCRMHPKSTLTSWPKRSLFWELVGGSSFSDLPGQLPFLRPLNQGFIKSSIDFDWKGEPPIIDSSMLLAGKVQRVPFPQTRFWHLASGKHRCQHWQANQRLTILREPHSRCPSPPHGCRFQSRFCQFYKGRPPTSRRINPQFPPPSSQNPTNPRLSAPPRASPSSAPHASAETPRNGSDCGRGFGASRAQGGSLPASSPQSAPIRSPPFSRQ